MMVFARAAGDVSNRRPRMPFLSPALLNTQQAVLGESRCPVCVKPPVDTLVCISKPCGVYVRNVCTCAPPATAVANEQMANRSIVYARHLCVGEVAPVSLRCNVLCTTHVNPAEHECRRVKGWARRFASFTEHRDSFDSLLRALRVLTLNAGGPAARLDELVCTILSHDPDMVMLQETRDTNLMGIFALKCFFIHHASIRGPWRGLSTLIHRRCVCKNTRPARASLHDT